MAALAIPGTGFRRRLAIPGHAPRARTPSILQMEAVECGAASLAMVLAHHGRWVPLEELRVRCGVSRDGTKAGNILKAARGYGLAAKGFRKEPDQLLSLPVPSIIHWNFNHFVVFEGIVGDGVFLNDPAIGRRRISKLELSEYFTGVVLAFETTPEFSRAGGPPEILPALWDRLRRSRSGLALVILASLLLILPGIVTPIFAKLFVDDVLVGGLEGWLGPLILGMAVTAAFRAALLWLQAHYLLRLETKLSIAAGSRFVWHLLQLPLSFFSQRHAGDLANRVEANDDFARILSGGVATTTLSLMTAGLFAVVMIAFDPRMAAVAIPLALLNAVALRLVGHQREAAAQRLMKHRSQLMGETVGAIRLIESIKASGLEEDVFSRWAGFQAKTMAASRDLDRMTAELDVIPALLLGLGIAGLLSVGSIEMMEGRATVGDIVAFLALASAFADPIGDLVSMAATLQEMKASLGRTQDVLRYKPDPRLATLGIAAEAPTDGPVRLRGAIDLEAVSFGYNHLEPPLIAEFSLSVRPGTRVALVGASGSGKSTLGRIVAGLYAPWEGRVLFDGRPLDGISPLVMANSVAYVDQDVFLFEGTVRDNATLWDPSIADADLALAIKDAGLAEDISVRAGRQEAHVAEGGVNFSGGQRQRMEIARALAGDPAILILDEAMAALDPIVEQEIDDNIRRRGCTCIIIAHRLSTIRDCDEIVMLKQGRVVGRGTHEALLADCDDYRKLLNAQ